MKWSALFCSVFAACGSGDRGPDISGIYQVTEMRVSETDCNPQDTPAMPDMYFLLENAEVSGQALVLHAICSFDNPACQSRNPVSSLDTPIDDGWQGGHGYAVEPAPCILHFDFGIATATGADTVAVEERNYSESSSTCDDDEATRRGAAMPCVRSKRWLGTKIREF